jgi:triphosphatase
LSDDPPREVELKFEVGPADLALLRQHRLLKRLKPAERMVSVYYDTPDFKLRRGGLSLRIRTSPNKRVQTVKSGGDDGPFSRGEWETPLGQDQPDLEATRDTPLDEALNDGDRASLGPMFASVVDRTVRQISEHGGGVELALDQGEVRAGDKSSPIAELELELKKGDPRALYRVAEDLFQVAPLRLSLRTKSESGYALLEPSRDHVLGVDPKLTPGMSAAAALRAIAHTGLSHFLPNERLVRRTRSPDSIHQARVALRRLRAALTLFKPLVDDPESRDLSTALKAAAGTLGAVRDLDVFLVRLKGLELPDEYGVDALVAHFQAAREAACDDAVAMLESPDFARLTLKLAGWIEAGDWTVTEAASAPVEVVAGIGLARRARKLRDRAKGLGGLEPAERHKVRIAAKKVRYGAEFFQGLADGKKERRRSKAFIGALRPLQEALGDLNDLSHVEGLLHRAADQTPALAFAAGAVADELRRQERPALKRAKIAAKRFRAARL